MVAYHLFAQGGQQGSSLPHLPLARAGITNFFKMRLTWTFASRHCTTYHSVTAGPLSDGVQ